MIDAQTKIEEVIENLADHYKPQDGGMLDIELKVTDTGENYYIQAFNNVCKSGTKPELDDELKAAGSKRTTIKLTRSILENLMRGRKSLKDIRGKKLKIDGSPSQAINITQKFNIKV